MRRARGAQVGSEVERVGTNARRGEVRARRARGGGWGQLWGSMRGCETVCGGGRRAHPGAAPRCLRVRRLLVAKTPARKVRVCLCTFFSARILWDRCRPPDSSGSAHLLSVARRSCAGGRGAYGGAGEGEQGEQTGLLAARTCGIGARGRRVGWAARRSGWSGREAHLARRSPPSCCVGDRVEEGDVAEEGWAQA